ncbi:NAD(P)-dependent dehydrogenase, short-chain alcohol dehydrogenase family [Cohaesibacter marisflavi]|uniref:NAD(P)-dependent dehydrogenase, short-chain alcohol dehydrogenase family n=1 Tax=Cohaesibacter marisflavi TaxID=655353 RepID=A0A1I5N302_9HYPH|nr:SDR family NAD(P)-dependent oxidoreductase [Cohaesibacter marisflavi]SFP15661.1 NAD(P)-dependent dehydrogenase, short-chain alcohol dehydrogenase family [Cohaesibacter marisflavi]
MANILITGSTQGVGLNAAKLLLDEGHGVILHARNANRAESFGDLAGGAKGVVIGDLSLMADVRRIVDQAASFSPIDAVIHNAGILGGSCRKETTEGHLQVLAVNALAPYLLSKLLPAARHIFTGSSMHFGHNKILEDLEWRSRRWSGSQAYGESKLSVTTLSAALARLCPNIVYQTVDPGWVPTRMGGASASDPLELAHVTQCWLATSNDAITLQSGQYWHHMKPRAPDAKVRNQEFQNTLLKHLARLSGLVN